MQEYIVERVDVSYCYVMANSEEEAIDKSNEIPDQWDIDIGEATAKLTDE